MALVGSIKKFLVLRELLLFYSVEQLIFYTVELFVLYLIVGRRPRGPFEELFKCYLFATV